MRKSIVLTSCLFILLLIFVVAAAGGADSSPRVSITGAVRQPVVLSLEDLSRFQSLSVRLNEVDSARHFHGSFHYQGVPLRTLLELAHIHKEEASFLKYLDVAVVVRNAQGKQAVFSWGEIFYRNPAEIMVAFAATPVMPLLSQGRKKWENMLARPIGFPKLVAADDFYTDRCLEQIVSIEVVVVGPAGQRKETPDLPASEFTISGSVKAPLKVDDLGAWGRIKTAIKVTGSGRGYQGLQQITGVPLVSILEKAGAAMDLNTVCLVSHTDGYRAVVSWGELFLNPDGKHILIADGKENQGVAKEGRFTLVIPNDLSSDRNVKGIASIEVVSLKPPPKVYIIGVGCADTGLITLEALNHLNKTDAVVCSADIANRFAFYIGRRPILFDPFQLGLSGGNRKRGEGDFSSQRLEKAETDKTSEALGMIRTALGQGKSVALLEYGDPLLYGGLRKLHTAFGDHEKAFVPGISAFNAANALIGREMGCRGSIVLTSPRALKDSPAMLGAVAGRGDTLAVFMGLREFKDLIPLLKRYYPGATPVTFAIRAGYAHGGRLIKTTLDKAGATARKENETGESWLGMIYIGSCLESR